MTILRATIRPPRASDFAGPWDSSAGCCPWSVYSPCVWVHRSSGDYPGRHRRPPAKRFLARTDMKNPQSTAFRIAASAGVVCAISAIGSYAFGPGTTTARSPQADTEASVPVETTATIGPYKYVGSKRCRMCHTKWHASWMESGKGDSWSSLLPGTKTQIKERLGLDAAWDYSADERCLACHSVGFGLPGGYAVPRGDDERAARRSRSRRGAGCESCHGPGSGFIEIMQDILHTDRSYVPEELYRAGRRPVTVDVCKKCHNDSAICQVGINHERSRDYDPTVDVEDRRGYHAAFPLVHRRREADKAETSRLSATKEDADNERRTE